MRINKHDTQGTKPLLGKGELGYDDYTAGGDTGRVYVGKGDANVALAKKSEVDTKVDKVTSIDNAIVRFDGTTGNVQNSNVVIDDNNNINTSGIITSTGGFIGNATSATKLQTARTISLTGDVTGSVSFDGSANANITATIAANSVALGTDTTGDYVAGNTAGTGITISGTAGEGWSPTIAITNVGTAGTYTKVTTNAQGQVTSGTTLSASDIPSLDASKITSGVIDAARLPAYVDDVLEFTNLAAFPVTGETGKIYVALDTNKTYRWSGSAYVYITSGAVDSVNGQTGVVNVTTITGNAGTATKLQTARTINGVSFDGSANISVNTNNSEIIKFDSGATEGTDLYTFNGSSAKTIDIKAGTNVTLTKAVGSITISANDTSVAWSEITSKPTTLSGYGITDAAPSSHVGATGTAHGNATTSVAGFMSNTDKTKLDGIATGANNYVHPTSGVASGSYAKVTVDANGHVTAGLVLTMEDIPDAAFKKSVRCATTGNLVATYASNVLTMSAVGVTVIDGVTIALNDRILVKDQTSTAHNGIYRVSTLGTASVATVFTRTTDADTSSEIAGAIVNVDSGTVNGGIAYTANFKTTDTLGTTGMPFYKLMYENGSWGISVTGSSASCTGNSATATTLQTARLIGGVSFNGSADITLPGVNTTGNQNTTGSAATLTTTRTFSATGDVTATAQNFNGSANVTLPMVLANSGVTAGTYSKVTVDAKGRVTAGLVLTMEDIPDATFKRSVRCATTANITLSGTQTIDGIAVVAGDRVLVKNQTTASQNGIYVVAAGAWTRALDANTSSKIASALVAVDSGTVNGGKLFDNDLKTTDALGTTSMVWSMNLDDASLLVSTSASIGTVRYNGTVAAAGQFDGGTTTPTGSNRLNYGGYFYPTFLNLTGSGDTTTASSHVFVETGSDGFVRPKTLANFKTEMFASPTLVTPNIGVATGTSFNSITGLSATTPSMDGTASVGTAVTVARADHVHPTDTTKVTKVTSTDNAVVRFNGTTGEVQNSLIGVDDSGNVGSGTQSFNGFGGSGFKNYIINGGFDVWQRGTNFSINGETFSADRWIGWHSSGGTISPSGGYIGFANSLLVSGASAGAVLVKQKIESVNSIKLGTDGNTKITISFYCRADVAGSNIKVEIRIPNTIDSWTGGYTTPKSVIVGTTSTDWTKYTVTFDLDFVYWSGIALVINGVSGVTNFYVCGVQLEKGSVATPFENRPYGLELSLCQRYYEAFRYQMLGNPTGAGQYFSCPIVYNTAKRTVPTLINISEYNTLATSFTFYINKPDGGSLYVMSSGAGVLDYRGYVSASAEL